MDDRDAGVSTEHPSRGIVTLTLECSNACVFCGQSGLEPLSPRSAQALRSELRALRSVDRVTFAGGEPGLVPMLEEHVAVAREEGFLRVGVQTNGTGLTEAGRMRRLAQSGLTDVHLSVLGAVAAVHDYHTGTAQSFDRTLQCLEASRAAGLDVVVNTVLTRSNFRTLDALAALLVARGAAAWCISIPFVTGRAAANFDRVIPRLGLALPFALRALSVARSRGVASFVAGAPLCLLGPHGADAIGTERRAYAAACAGCLARDVCPGVDAAYLARFEGDELAPRSTIVRPVDSASSRRFGDVFVGPGERAPALALEAAASPAKARRALPMLGRGQPAIAEAGRGEKRSGEALRALFPTLFETGARPDDEAIRPTDADDDGTGEPPG